jgi:transposase
MVELTLPLTTLHSDGRTTINEHCWLYNTNSCVAVFVNGVVLLTYDEDDIAAKRLAMVQLVESSAATQQQVAKSFRVNRLTVFRLRKRYAKGGVAGLLGKKRGPKQAPKTGGRQEKVIRRLRDEGKTQQEIASRLGVTDAAIRQALKRMGYVPKEKAPQQLPIAEVYREEGEVKAAVQGEKQDEEGRAEEAEAEEAEKEAGAVEAADSAKPADNSQKEGDKEGAGEKTEEKDGQKEPGASEFEIAAQTTVDPDPANRVFDRFFARLGLLEDAAPLFQNVRGVAGAGVLLAIPILVTQGVFVDAMEAFTTLGAAFYGLRNTVVTLLMCFLRGINRPEQLKEHSPVALGQVMGLDRAPEMKTMRRKIRALASQNRALTFINRQAQRLLMRLKGERLWLYVDGHVSVYSGKRKLKKHHVTRLRISLPSVLDYWVNDEKGDPVLVLTGRPRKGMVSMIGEVIKEVRGLGEERPITLIFDREGWSPALFARIEAMRNVRFVTYRKAKRNKKLPRVDGSMFEELEGEFDGESAKYDLADKRIYVDYGRGKKKKRLVLRQITRRTEDGHQTHIVTNDWQTSALEIAHRMFSRWGQENFFKYMREKKDFDGLVTYLMEEADANRVVANPERKAVKEQLSQRRVELERLLSKYGERALDNEEEARPTMRGFKIANGKLGHEIRRIQKQIEALETKLKKIPAKVPLSSIMGNETANQVHTPTRQLLHSLRMAAFRAETALRELLRPEYSRWRKDGRVLIRTFLNSTGDIEVHERELRVTFEKQSAPHRTQLLTHLCTELNALNTGFPGSDLSLKFAVHGAGDVT